mgnify:CR=1 FL=1|jgi:hypothetical protein
MNKKILLFAVVFSLIANNLVAQQNYAVDEMSFNDDADFDVDNDSLDSLPPIIISKPSLFQTVSTRLGEAKILWVAIREDQKGELFGDTDEKLTLKEQTKLLFSTMKAISEGVWQILEPSVSDAKDKAKDKAKKHLEKHKKMYLCFGGGVVVGVATTVKFKK